MTGEKEQFLGWYNQTIEAKAERFMGREAKWTEALAVGSSDWLDTIKDKLGKKRLIFKPTQKEQNNKKEYYIPESSIYCVKERPSQYAIY